MEINRNKKYVRPVTITTAIECCSECLLTATGENDISVSSNSINSGNSSSFQYESKFNDWDEDEDW